MSTAATQELITQPAPGSGGALAVYDRVTDVVGFVTTMGKAFGFSGVGGCKTQEQGQVLAFACLCKRMDPFTFSARYHLVEGKPQMQAHIILAGMHKGGCKIDWVHDGDDGVAAEATFCVSGQQPKSIRYTMTDAKKSGVVKDGSAWVKSPGAMLRAAVVRKAAKMLMPWVLEDDCDPEEFEAWQAATPTNGTAVAAAATRSPEEIEKRRQELQATATAGTAPVQATAETIIDVQVEKPATTESAPVQETAPFVAESTPVQTSTAVSANNELTAVLLSIQQIVTGPMGMKLADFEAGLKVKNPAFTGLQSLDVARAKNLLANLEAKYSAAKNG